MKYEEKIKELIKKRKSSNEEEYYRIYQEFIHFDIPRRYPLRFFEFLADERVSSRNLAFRLRFHRIYWERLIEGSMRDDIFDKPEDDSLYHLVQGDTYVTPSLNGNIDRKRFLRIVRKWRRHSKIVMKWVNLVDIDTLFKYMSFDIF